MRHLIIMAISLLLALPSVSLAEVVGKLTQVEGRVELLKGGKLPAAAAKVQDGVEPGDVLRTKLQSRAQITFLDNTTVTISPESRIAIEKYLFDPSKGKRNVVLELFQGLAHLVVTQVFKVQEPNLQLKTNTGVMGVRGTDVGIRLGPKDTTFLDFHGRVRVANIIPQVGGAVELRDMQGTVVAWGKPPTRPFDITEEDQQLFMLQLDKGPQARISSGDGVPRMPGGLGNPPGSATVPKDIVAGLPMEKVIANGLGAGVTIEAILSQALDAGAGLCPLIRGALAQGIDLTRIFKALLDKCKADPKAGEKCSICAMMKCAKEAGRDPVEIANAMMAAGASLEQVRECLASMGFPDADTYTYTPPEPPEVPIGVGPTFPGTGTGGTGRGGGGVASPSS